MTITEADHAHLSWHARQQLNTRLRAETKTLTAQLAQLRKDRATIKRFLARRNRALRDRDRTAESAYVAETVAAAIALLATLHDPAAAAHRLASMREIHPREARP